MELTEYAQIALMGICLVSSLYHYCKGDMVKSNHELIWVVLFYLGLTH